VGHIEVEASQMIKVESLTTKGTGRTPSLGVGDDHDLTAKGTLDD